MTEAKTTRVVPAHQLCHARSKSRGGKPCSQRVVPGAMVCRFHGGGAPQVIAKAAKRVAMSELVTWGDEMIQRHLVSTNRDQAGGLGEVDPGSALMEVLQICVIAERAYAALVSRADGVTVQEIGPGGFSTSAVRPEVALWNESLDRVARVSALLLKAGVAEREVRMVEAQAGRMVEAVLSALADTEWGLSDDMQARGKRVMARHFRALSDGAS